MVKEINKDEFNEVIKEKKVLVDCFANWCGPCKMLSPVLDNLSEEIKDYNFYKLDVDKANDIAVNYNVMSIPTLLIFNDGSLVNRIVGLKSVNEIKEMLK